MKGTSGLDNIYIPKNNWLPLKNIFFNDNRWYGSRKFYLWIL